MVGDGGQVVRKVIIIVKQLIIIVLPTQTILLRIEESHH